MKSAVALLAVVAVAFLPSPGQAEQYPSGGNVVHTNPVPVVLHRIVPPYRGVHVYQGRGGRR